MTQSKNRQQLSARANTKPIQLQPIVAPSVYATAITAMMTSNDLSLVFAKAHPALTPSGELSETPVIVPTAVVSMSISTAKDMYLLLKAQIEEYERTHGEIETDFSKSLTQS